MKKKVLAVMSVVVGCFMFSACSADTLNSVINKAASEAGVDVHVDIEQEDLDKAIDALEDVKNKAEDIVTDEDVQKAGNDLFDAIKNAGEE